MGSIPEVHPFRTDLDVRLFDSDHVGSDRMFALRAFRSATSAMDKHREITYTIRTIQSNDHLLLILLHIQRAIYGYLELHCQRTGAKLGYDKTSSLIQHHLGEKVFQKLELELRS